MDKTLLVVPILTVQCEPTWAVIEFMEPEFLMFLLSSYRVCGTPGSMVHFYDKLTSIVFDTVESSLNDVLSSSHVDYKRLQQSVISAARSSSPSSLSPGSDNVAYFQPPSRQDTPSLPLNGGSLIPLRRKRGLDTLAMRPVLQRIGKRRSAKVDHGSNDVADRLQSAMKEARTVLRRECGGDLQQCSWERDMKVRIFAFPISATSMMGA